MADYTNRAQYGAQAFTWDPSAYVFSGDIQENSPGYLTEMLGRLDRQGQLQPWEADELAQWQAQAKAIPTRDIAGLTAQWQGENRGGDFDEQGLWRPYDPQWWSRLDPGSPDAGPIMLGIRDKINAGQASAQERALYDQTLGMAQDWNYRASVPQASDAFSLFGDNLLGALAVLGMGASGGLAGGALAAGGGLASTLGSLGTLSGIAGTGAGTLGQAMDQDWLQALGLGLGAAGGILGGVGGLSNLWGTGVGSLGDAAKLASSAGRVVGGVGAIADNDALKEAGGWLGTAGQVGGGVENLMHLVGGTGGSLQGVAELAKPLSRIAGRFLEPGREQAAPQQPRSGMPAGPSSPQAPAQDPGGIQALLQAAQQAQRGPAPGATNVDRTMTNEDWLRWTAPPGPWRPTPAAPSVLWHL